MGREPVNGLTLPLLYDINRVVPSVRLEIWLVDTGLIPPVYPFFKISGSLDLRPPSRVGLSVIGF